MSRPMSWLPSIVVRYGWWMQTLAAVSPNIPASCTAALHKDFHAKNAKIGRHGVAAGTGSAYVKQVMVCVRKDGNGFYTDILSCSRPQLHASHDILVS